MSSRLRGLDKDAQCAIYRPFILVMRIWTLVCLRAVGDLPSRADAVGRPDQMRAILESRDMTFSMATM